jgi:hypothetical protein
LKIDGRKKSVQQTGSYPESLIQIAHRAKKLLRSWQGLLNTPSSELNNQATNVNPNSAATASPPAFPGNAVNGESHETNSTPPETNKPRIILKVKFNSSVAPNSNHEMSKGKRKGDPDLNGPTSKRRKARAEPAVSSLPPPVTPVSPPRLLDGTTSLPRLKTTQQLLMEMQLNQPDVLSTQTPTVNAILHKQIVDESLHDTSKVDYSALHHGRDVSNNSLK